MSRLNRSPRGMSLSGKTFLGTFLLVLVGAAAASTFNVAVADQPLRVLLRNGSSLVVDAESMEIIWSEFRPQGSNAQQRFSLTSIARLRLSESPASEMLDQAKQLLADLYHADYHRREAAEASLKDLLLDSSNSTLKELVAAAVNDERLEVQYRAQRILSAASSSAPSNSASDKFDWLWLKEGRQLRGDAGDVTLRCRWRGIELQWARSEIAEIQVAPHEIPANEPVPDSWITAGPLRLHQPPEKRPLAVTQVDFETDPVGNALQRGEFVDRIFTDWGLIFETGVGNVGISGYEIQFEGIPTKANSICAYDTSGNYTRRFKGAIEISFCMPARPAQPAGVHWFECYAARLDNPRDFILQAFNDDGHLLATVEASDHPCGFFAVGSAEPIARIRFMSNPHLFHLKRRIDDDFALDNLAFSPPVPVAGLVSTQWTVGLKNGDRWSVKDVHFGNQGTITLSDGALKEPLPLPLAEVGEIIFPQSKFPAPIPNSKDWLVLAEDRSVIAVQPGPPLKPVRAQIAAMTDENLLALWSNRDYLRFPDRRDFERAQSVLVFPNASILASTLPLEGARISWSPDTSSRRYQDVFVKQPGQVQENGLGKDEEAPLPETLNSIELSEPNSGHLPSLWFAPTAPQSTTRSAVMLKNGEQFVLGGTSGFKLKSISAAGVAIVISRGDQSPATEPLEIGFDEIRRITF